MVACFMTKYRFLYYFICEYSLLLFTCICFYSHQCISLASDGPQTTPDRVMFLMYPKNIYQSRDFTFTYLQIYIYVYVILHCVDFSDYIISLVRDNIFLLVIYKHKIFTEHLIN